MNIEMLNIKIIDIFLRGSNFKLLFEHFEFLSEGSIINQIIDSDIQFRLRFKTPHTVKHRNQRCKAPSICKTILLRIIVNKKKQVKINIFLQRLSNNFFLTMSFPQHLSHNVFLTPLLLHIRQHNVVLTTSQYTRNISVLNKCRKISQIRLSSMPCSFDICD